MYYFNFLTSLFVLSCVLGSGLAKKLPDYIKVCKWDQTTIDECARQSIEALRPTLVLGIPEINLPPTDPYFIPEVVPIGGTRQIRASGRNVTVWGASKFDLKSLNIDLDSMTFKARIRFPKFHLEGLYRVDATMLTLPMIGEGKFSTDVTKCDVEGLLHAEVEKRDGKEYLHFDKLDLNINIKDYKVNVDGLFEGDRVLSEAINQVINQNRKEMMQLAKPYIEATVTALLLDVANKIVEDITLDQLLPKP